MTVFRITIDAAPGSGADVDALGRAHDAAQTLDVLIDPIVIAHGDETNAQLSATFTLDATDVDECVIITTDVFAQILAAAGVTADQARIDHLEIIREHEHYAAA